MVKVTSSKEELAELIHQREQLEQERQEIINNETNDDNINKVREIDRKIENINYELHGSRSSNYSLRTHKNKLENQEQEFIHKLNKLDEKQDEILSKEEKIRQLEETARGLIKRTTSASLGKQFSERKDQLEQNLEYWKYASIGSILVLLLFAGFIYYDISTSTTTTIDTNIAKVFLILSVSVAVWFTVSNYRRQKILMEEYEFRARMALSLDGYREILRDEQISEDSEIVAEFVRDTMDKIYLNPQENALNLDEGGDDSLIDRQRPSRSILPWLR
ncbi:AAA family ATPase [Halohasta litchfieldiae]|uniref:Uncharacterized protein n=1 Tax=Halohasta litchfieldiae TaxID=1073996 RepID=A0A1H6Y6A0_9EURY|nr:hypothetical protein [Halohasta litchfieldiae]SEJ36761.1 hypothetical protein SAMN05444271_15812 [Halohasta litchfieldiae]